MQERVNEKTVAVAVQATKMSGRMIARMSILEKTKGRKDLRSLTKTLRNSYRI
jgi:hypothetical protein